jgi:hypothetical protein
MGVSLCLYGTGSLTLPAIMPMIVVPVMPGVMPVHDNYNANCRFSLLRRIKAGKHEQHCQSQQPTSHSQFHRHLNTA